jgi:glycosyltransferase involved in cell wall biosynthesis
MLKISIVTAVRNGAAAIIPTLESIREQSYSAIEHVIIDGASTDSTAEIVRSRGSRDLRFLSERDSGVYDAFNKGLRLATGDVIGFLNAGDTYWSTQSVHRIAEAFQDDAIQVAYGDVMIVDGIDTAKPVRRYRSSRFTPDRIAYGWMPAHPTLFMRRAVYDRFGLYDPTYRIAGDFEMVARVFARGGIRSRCIDEILVRMPRGGLSTSGPRASYIITREMHRGCTQNGISTNYLKLVWRFASKLIDYLRPGN